MPKGPRSYVPAEATRSDRLYAVVLACFQRYDGRLISDPDFDTAHGMALLAYAEVEKICKDFLDESCMTLDEHIVIRPTYELLPGHQWMYKMSFELFVDGEDKGAIREIAMDHSYILLATAESSVTATVPSDPRRSEVLYNLACYALDDVRGPIVNDDGTINPLEFFKQGVGRKPR